MTKTQAQARARKIIKDLLAVSDQLRDLQYELSELQEHVENAIEKIVPYKNNIYLTAQQEEKEAYLKELSSQINNVCSMDIEDTIIAFYDFIEDN